MKRSVMLTVTSLLLISLAMVHLAQDIVYGYEPGTVNNLLVVPIAVVWLYGTLVLAGRRSGYIIMLLGAIVGTGIPILHMAGAGLVGGRIANSHGAFFWVWQNFALCVISACSVILAVRGLWSLPWRRRQ